MFSMILQQEVPDTEDIGALLQALADAVASSEWGTLAGVVALVLVWIATKFGPMKSWLRGAAGLWVGAVSAVVSAFVVGWMSTGSWMTALSSVVTTGATGALVALITRAVKGGPIEDKDGDGKLDPLPEGEDDEDPSDES